MLFNPDISKQSQEVIFSRKNTEIHNLSFHFYKTPVDCTPFQNHLGMYLDERLDFNYHVKEKIAKANKTKGIIRKLVN